MATTGTWLGLPDFGITEKISSALGTHQGSWGLPELGLTEKIQSTVSPSSPTTYQGGSNLWGSQPQPANASVLGTQAPQSTPQMQSTGGGGGFSMDYYKGWDPAAAQADWNATGGAKAQQTQVDPYSQLRGEIGGAWDSYIGSLDEQLNGLTGQRGGQEQLAMSQFNQSSGDLDLQRNQGISSLGNERVSAEQNQAKNLRDLGSNLKNAFMAGNVYLGSRGAGDSSAADQYSGALTKMASRQRSDITQNTSNIMADIGSRETNLNQIYGNERMKLQEGLNQAKIGISQWYDNAVNTIKMQKAQGQLQKGQDIASLTRQALDYALSELQRVQQQASSRQASLESWALSNAQSINQLKTNFKEISNPAYNLPQAQNITGNPQFTSDGRIYVPQGYGYSNTDEKKSIFR